MAILCNHQKTVAKNFDEQVHKMRGSLEAKKEKLSMLEGHARAMKREEKAQEKASKAGERAKKAAEKYGEAAFADEDPGCMECCLNQGRDRTDSELLRDWERKVGLPQTPQTSQISNGSGDSPSLVAHNPSFGEQSSGSSPKRWSNVEV